MKFPFSVIGALTALVTFPSPRSSEDVVPICFTYCGVGALVGMLFDFYFFWWRAKSVPDQPSRLE
jgi:hypothetical protein